MRRLAFLISLLLATSLHADNPYRQIAIMENERMLEMEPHVRLVSFFHARNMAIRERAVLAAARIGNKSVLSDLIKRLKDKDVLTRKYIAFALGQIRERECVAYALKLIGDPDADVRRLAIEALGRIGGTDLSTYLLPFLNDPNVLLREQAALALALIKDKATVEPLIARAGLDDPAQWSYVYALYRLADERSLPVLHQVIAHPSESPSTGDPSSVLYALKALWSMKKPLSAEEQSKLLNFPDPRVQQNAMDVINASADKTACALIDRRFISMNLQTQLKAIEAMGTLGCNLVVHRSGGDVPMMNDVNGNIAGTALIAFAKQEKSRSLHKLEFAYKHPWMWGFSFADTAWYVAQASGSLDAEDGVQLLKNMLNDSKISSLARMSALDSLRNFMPQAEEVFIPLLKSKDFAQRAIAADALAKTKDAKYVPMLIEAYKASSNPAEIEGRIDVLDALAEFNDSTALEVFESALLDPEYTIRRHAIDGIKKLAGSKIMIQGKLVDPESFLYRSGKVSAATAAKYPQDYGAPVPDYIAEIRFARLEPIRIRLLGKEAPTHVLNFKKLAESGAYNGLTIHRVVPNFVVQGGDPRGDGWGSAGEILHDQMNLLTYKRGSVGMPLAGKDTGGSQFFITLSRQPHLDGNYTIFGEVISGMATLDQLQVGTQIESVTVQTQ